MKKIYLTIFFLIFSNLLLSQKKIPINLYKSTQLIFNLELKEVIVGTGETQVLLNKKENLISLVSIASKKDFITTNLFVSTKEGYHFNFDLVYKEFSDKWTFPIDDSYSIIKPKIKEEKIVLNTENLKKKLEKDNSILEKVLKDKRRLKRYRSRFDDIIFSYINHYYLNQEIYYKIKIENKSNQDYQIDYIKFFVDTKGKKNIQNNKKSNTRRLLKNNKDYFLINDYQNIKSNKELILVYKFKKISFNKEQKFVLELKEEKGNRDLILELPSRLVNDPLKL